MSYYSKPRSQTEQPKKQNKTETVKSNTNSRKKQTTKQRQIQETKDAEDEPQIDWDEIFDETRMMMVSHIPPIQEAVLRCLQGADKADEMSHVLQTLKLLNEQLTDLIDSHDVFNWYNN